MSAYEEQPYIECLNQCAYDEETGYCLSCGRPPVVETGFDAGFLARMLEQEKVGEKKK
jgi:hypothetical protein